MKMIRSILYNTVDKVAPLCHLCHFIIHDPDNRDCSFSSTKPSNDPSPPWMVRSYYAATTQLHSPFTMDHCGGKLERAGEAGEVGIGTWYRSTRNLSPDNRVYPIKPPNWPCWPNWPLFLPPLVRNNPNEIPCKAHKHHNLRISAGSSPWCPANESTTNGVRTHESLRVRQIPVAGYVDYVESYAQLQFQR